MRHVLLYGLLGIVATAAAVLSFSALRDLALLCGFSTQLAWLLPVAIDAGAAAGSLVWHGRRHTHAARRYAQILTLALLATSVAANALSHYLAAEAVTPAWQVVVVVSAVAPAVLGSVIYLGVLVTGGEDAQVSEPLHPTPPLWESGGEPAQADGETWEQKRDRLLYSRAGRKRLQDELGITEHAARQLLKQRSDLATGELETDGEGLA